MVVSILCINKDRPVQCMFNAGRTAYFVTTFAINVPLRPSDAMCRLLRYDFVIMSQWGDLSANKPVVCPES
jgi:hypothetical protein